MKPNTLHLIADNLKTAAEALTKIALLLGTAADEMSQPELPTISIALAEPIEHSPGYLESKKAAETPPAVEAPKKETETPKPVEPEITRQSLRALAEKLVAMGRLHMFKGELAKFGAANLSALKPENFVEMHKLLLIDLGEGK